MDQGSKTRQFVLRWLRKNVEMLVRLSDEWYPPPSNPTNSSSATNLAGVDGPHEDISDASMHPPAGAHGDSDTEEHAEPQPYNYTHIEHEFDKMEKTLEQRGQLIAGLQAEVQQKDKMVRDMLDRLSWESAPDSANQNSSHPEPTGYLNHNDSSVAELEHAKQALESERLHRARVIKRLRAFMIELRSLLEVTHTEQFLTSGRPTGSSELVISTEFDPESEFLNTPLRTAIQLQRTNKMLQNHIEHLSREVVDRDVLIKSLLAQIDERDEQIRSNNDSASAEPPAIQSKQ